MTINTEVLPNGITVVTEKMPGYDSASVGIWVAAGSRCEESQENGMAHLLEHMAFKGTKTRTALQIAKEIEEVGGQVNACTSTEYTSYYSRVLGKDVGLALRILSDVLTNSVFDQEELQKEKHVIYQEIGSSHDSPMDHMLENFHKTAFAEQAIGRSILGTPATLQAFQSDDIFSFLDKHYCGDNMIVAASGNVIHGEIVEIVAQSLSSIKKDRKISQDAAHYVGGHCFEHRDLTENQMTLGFQGLFYNHPQYYTINLLSCILGGGMSSRLFQEVREKRGLCYAISSFHWAFQDTGIFCVYSATSPEKADELIRVAANEILQICHTLKESDLEKAKEQMKASIKMSMESPSARSKRLAHHLMNYGKIISVDDVIKQIDSVTSQDIQQLSRDIFISDKQDAGAIETTMSVLGPKDVTAAHLF